MSIHLFGHNEEAYRAVTEMLKRSGMAAVIHPTGTGKSMIAFKLVEEHPLNHFLWLSPSEYIYQTQIENLNMKFPNIQFMSYSRLMKNEDSIDTLDPDYIILDEFHRCGAQEWGKSVRKLLDTYPDVKRLGLSATNIRYLDNQRNMAEEIFDGNIASEMTLGEAIIREILPEPKYVIAMYSYKKELDQFLLGKSAYKISKELNEKGILSPKGIKSQGESVTFILRNERYVGDCEMQKTVTVDFLSHKSIQNNGEAPKFYVTDHHVPIISRTTWTRAQEVLETGFFQENRTGGADSAAGGKAGADAGQAERSGGARPPENKSRG